MVDFYQFCFRSFHFRLHVFSDPRPLLVEYIAFGMLAMPTTTLPYNYNKTWSTLTASNNSTRSNMTRTLMAPARAPVPVY
jgi:hypothetical protein